MKFCTCVAGQIYAGLAGRGGHQDVEIPKAEVAKTVVAPRLDRTPGQTQNSDPHWRDHGGVCPWVKGAEDEETTHDLHTRSD